MNFSQKNIHLNRALELGSSCNVKQLFLAENPDGSISLRGDLDIREASKRLLKVIRMEDAVKCDWLTRGAPDFPKMPRNMKFILKQPRMLKNALTSAGVKLGQGTFLAWHFPVEKAYLVHTAGLVDKLPNMFTLSNIIEWSAFKGTSISNGNISALKMCFKIFFINIDKLSP